MNVLHGLRRATTSEIWSTGSVNHSSYSSPLPPSSSKDHGGRLPESPCHAGTSRHKGTIDSKSSSLQSKSTNTPCGDPTETVFNEPVRQITSPKNFGSVIVIHWVVHERLSSPCEIVEFSWVIYHIPSDSVLEKVRLLIQPTESLLESISETTLNTLKIMDLRPFAQAKTLEQVLLEFDTASSLMNPLCVCVISDAVTLRDQLLAETFRKGIHVPQCLRSVLDLSTLAPHFYTEQFFKITQQTFSPQEIANHLSIQVAPQGDEFWTTHGCLTMCQIIRKFSTDRIHFQTEHLSTVITVPVAAGSPSNYLETNIANENSHSTCLRMEQEQYYVIRLRGVPWGVTKDDVIEFLKPVCRVMPSAIFIGMTYAGKASGEVYVRLSNAKDRDQCIQELHGRYMGSRWIEVFKGCQNDIQQMALLPDTASQEKIGAVRLRGLPWSTKPFDLVKFFSEAGFTISPNAIVWGHGYDGRFNGDAWVLLSSVKEMENAQRLLHKKILKRRYIEVFPATAQEVELASRGSSLATSTLTRGIHSRATPYSVMELGALAVHQDLRLDHHLERLQKFSALQTTCSHGDKRTGNAHAGIPQHSTDSRTSNSNETFGTPVTFSNTLKLKSNDTTIETSSRSDKMDDEANAPPHWMTSVLRMRGLPYHATEEHISNFFDGFTISSIITAEVNTTSRPSGEVYVEFASRAQAWKALRSKNGGIMDHRYIELFPTK